MHHSSDTGPGQGPCTGVRPSPTVVDVDHSGCRDGQPDEKMPALGSVGGGHGPFDTCNAKSDNAQEGDAC